MPEIRMRVPQSLVRVQGTAHVRMTYRSHLYYICNSLQYSVSIWPCPTRCAGDQEVEAKVVQSPAAMAKVLQKLHFVTGKTLKDVRSDIVVQPRSCRSWMRAVLLLLIFGLIGAVVACKYVFEDQLRSLQYPKRITGYKACVALSEDLKPTCFCCNASTTYERFATFSDDTSWCQRYQYPLPGVSDGLSGDDLLRQSAYYEVVAMCERTVYILTEKMALLQLYSPTMRTKGDLEADLKRLAVGTYLDIVDSLVIQKLLSNLEFNTSINLNGLSPRLAAAQTSAVGQKIISGISGLQYNSLQEIMQSMRSHDMVDTLVSTILMQFDYSAYQSLCYPYECTYTVQKTLYVLAVEFLGVLGGLVQLALGLGSLILWPAVMICCRWESGDRAWDPQEEDVSHLPTARPVPMGSLKTSY